MGDIEVLIPAVSRISEEVTPHIATATRECRIKTGVRVAENVKLVAAGKKPQFCVNL